MTIVQSQVLEPYAQGLMSVAQTHNITEEIGNDMRSLLSLLQDSPDLEQFLANPFVKPEGKKAAIEQITGEQINQFTRNFLKILVDRGRILFLEGVCQQYLALLRKFNQTVLAEVTATVPLNEAQEGMVREKVLAMTGARQVELEVSIDPELIGGVIIKVGSQVIDASLRGQVRRIGLSLSKSS